MLRSPNLLSTGLKCGHWENTGRGDPPTFPDLKAAHPFLQEVLPAAPPHTTHKSMLLFLVLVGSPGRGAKSRTGPVWALYVLGALGNPRAVRGPLDAAQ